MEYDLIHNISFQWRPTKCSTKMDIAHLSPLSYFKNTFKTTYIQPCVDVVIPTKQYDHKRYLHWLKNPEVAQIIVLYNGPPTTSIVSHDKIVIIHCNWLGHGATRNLAIPKIKSKYIFFTVDDAIPLRSTLSPLVEFLDNNNNREASAIVARQCPWPTAHPYIQHRIFQYMPTKQSKPYLFHQCDNVGTLYRSNIFINDPFPTVDIAEDYIWALNKKIYCHPNACILHSHQRNPIDLFHRERHIHRVLKNYIDISTSTETILFTLRQAQKHGLREGLNTFFENLGMQIGYHY